MILNIINFINEIPKKKKKLNLQYMLYYFSYKLKSYREKLKKKY